VRCGLRRSAQLMGVLLVILAFIPLLSPHSLTAYSTRIFNFAHYYTRPIVQQWYEAHFSPVAAIGLASLALLVMLLTPRSGIHPLARGLICLAAGFFGFGFFRVTLGMIYAEALVWATFWEELTELIFVCALVFVLWVFRQTLLPGFSLKKLLPA
jgi:hypothetical protein